MQNDALILIYNKLINPLPFSHPAFCFRLQLIRRRRQLHQVAVHGTEHEEGSEGNLLPLDLCHRHKERADCVQRCDRHHHQRKP